MSQIRLKNLYLTKYTLKRVEKNKIKKQKIITDKSIRNIQRIPTYQKANNLIEK